MARSFVDIHALLERVDKESNLEVGSADSEFRHKLLAFLPQEGEAGELAKRLALALEMVLVRNHKDNRLLVSLCLAFKELSDLPFSKLFKRLDRALASLNVPAGSWVAKNLRAARVVDSHPSLSELADFEAFSALEKLPEDSLKSSGTDSLIEVGEETLDIRSASKKEVLSAVRKAKSERSKDGKRRKDDEVGAGVQEAGMGEALPPWEDPPEEMAENDDGSPEVRAAERNGEPSLVADLSDAEQAISRLLSNLPRDSRLEELFSALEKTRMLVAFARSDLDLPAEPMSEENQTSLQ